MAEVIRRTSDDPALAAQIPNLAQRLQANARSLADLVSDVLDASSFGSGRVSLHERNLSLNALLAEECDRLLPLAEAKGLHLAADLPEPAIWLRADKVSLARIVGNLLGNAIKFTETGGVTVTAELPTEQDVLIRVRDTGIGIAPENLARIFDEYAQMSNRGRDRTRGWGLGLAICRRLGRGHRWKHYGREPPKSWECLQRAAARFACRGSTAAAPWRTARGEERTETCGDGGESLNASGKEGSGPC